MSAITIQGGSWTISRFYEICRILTFSIIRLPNQLSFCMIFNIGGADTAAKTVDVWWEVPRHRRTAFLPAWISLGKGSRPHGYGG